ncbi:polynucleotide kinase-phosphatase [Acanthopleuribacter pedis]|uniref:Polynucleotide kinase-phosphatase n=1 Tax=Acanthopleuribacter pedis TaxID=442870 RepID=A0A8J7QCC0_9BACT|nr:polynucleotide kinase-phosphatase [Acanthopleuribacter pedis]MBO1323086.1 polynucleotide kinase-phosphatase [Acanthopleuribacter pedis]
MKISIPDLSLVLLVGPSGSGKSTFAARHFLPTEVISSDRCRGMVCDDENSLEASSDAFDLVHYWAGKRLKRGKRAVIDATNVQRDARASLIKLARDYHARVVAIVLETPEAVCHERNASRPDRNFGPHVVRGQHRDMRRSIKHLKKEGLHHVYRLDTPEKAAEAEIVPTPMWPDRRDERGPFDLIGDIHGCFDETLLLLAKLGYRVREEPHEGETRFIVDAPQGRRVVFLGDLVDRGPASNRVLRLAMDMVEAGVALCVPGNHENKLERWLGGRKKIKPSHGLAATIEQLETETPAFRERVRTFINGLVSHMILDEGRLIVAHAGMKESYAGRASGVVRSFALYGETTGETDSYGLPVRYDWAAEYRGKAAVVYGHTPVPNATWVNRTICLDTGCVFGGKLTALRWPERELVAVPAAKMYYEPAKPMAEERAERPGDEPFRIEDVRGKRIVNTRFDRQVVIREEFGMAAMEVISRFAVDPRWLTYLPATMAPTETSKRAGYLEHPEEAFATFRRMEISEVICQEKHMGSRAVVQLCQSAEVARQRFGTEDDAIGIVYTRSGRRFFTDRDLEQAFLTRLVTAVGKAGLWDSLETEWLTLDCELMPWSAKGLDLLQQQYARVGAAASAAIPATLAVLEQAQGRGIDVAPQLAAWRHRETNLALYRRAYGHYCWETDGLQGLRLAPFHILAGEGKAHYDKDHLWHMQQAEALAAADPELIQATRYRRLMLDDAEAESRVTQWWLDMTEAGGEGMVVKPIAFVPYGKDNRIILPAVKCRGRDYLRIIYGPDYTEPAQLERLRSRGLNHKRRNAVREYLLGLEALARFAAGDSISQVHECVTAIAALETEPIDPRL